MDTKMFSNTNKKISFAFTFCKKKNLESFIMEYLKLRRKKKKHIHVEDEKISIILEKQFHSNLTNQKKNN